MNESVAHRFWPKVRKTNDCWLWTGCRQRGGYGLLSVPGRRGASALAHRVAWELTVGPIPEGKWVLHRCDNRSCVRTSHLFVGDNAANMADMWQKERGILPTRQPTAEERARGASQGSSKLTDEAVASIRQRYAAGETQTALANEFGINQTQVGRIVRRESWRHVP